MKEHPLITIGITSFNAEDTIERAIKSALVQTYPKLEILIIDDCSSDNSSKIIKEAIKNQSHVRFIPHTKNTGFAGALNTIIENATGDFLAIFDDDDISVPERIFTQYNRIALYEENFETDLVLCHAARMQIFDNGLERYEKTVGTKKGQAPHGNDMANRILYGDLGTHGSNIVGSCANCARMGRTKTFRELNGFDATMRRGEDTDFSIRFALMGGHFVGIEEPLVYQTMTTGAEKTLDKEYNVEKTFTQKYEDYLTQIGWYKFAIEWLDIRYANLLGQKVKFLFLLSFMFLRHPIKTIKKLKWSLPAHDTRKSFKEWHLGKYAEEKSS